MKRTQKVKVKQLIIPAKTLFELMKITSYMDDETVKLYLEKSKITIKTEKNIINNVRVLGPTRNHTQVEISKTDAGEGKIQLDFSKLFGR